MLYACLQLADLNEEAQVGNLRAILKNGLNRASSYLRENVNTLEGMTAVIGEGKQVTTHQTTPGGLFLSIGPSTAF